MTVNDFLKLEPELSKPDPVFDRILAALREDTPLIYTKLNHGLWERLVFLDRIGESYLEQDPEKAAAIDKIRRHTPALVETGFITELFELLQHLPTDNPNFVFSANLEAFPHCGPMMGIPTEDERRCLEKIQKYVPESANGIDADGLEFKRALINGRLVEFTNLLKQESFLLVANSDLELFPEFIGARSAEYYPISGTHARFERNEILDGLKKELDASGHNRRVIMQAGGELSYWFAIQLHEWDPSVSVIDLGTAMCVCNPAAIFGRGFGQLFRAQIMHTMQEIHSGWFGINKHRESKFYMAFKFSPWVCSTGRSGNLVGAAKRRGVPVPERIWNPPIPNTTPVAFIENKLVDHDRIEDFLSLSIGQNHHSNGGPVSRLLEECIEIQLQLPPQRKAVVCASCTVGIQIAAGAAAIKRGRPLHWIGSAFGFLSSNIGHLAGIQLIDCSDQGGFDIQYLRQLHDSEWDGVLFTNAFGVHTAQWKALRQLCRNRNKTLIVDNAVGLLDRPSYENDTPEIEVISCHHTKPWGYGEGGIMIVHENDESLVRQLINFGVSGPFDALPYATNAKISDLACAAILDRLERMPHWSEFYRFQARRIRTLIEKNGLPLEELHGFRKRRSQTSNLQFLAAGDVSTEHLENEYLVLRKYYRPLRSEGATDPAANSIPFANAESIYRRIINIPCHPFVRALSPDQICDALASALAKAQNTDEELLRCTAITRRDTA